MVIDFDLNIFLTEVIFFYEDDFKILSEMIQINVAKILKTRQNTLKINFD